MTGFTASEYLSRNRVSLKEAFEGLELCERKLSCTVLRGLDGSNPVRLLGDTSTIRLTFARILYFGLEARRAHPVRGQGRAHLSFSQLTNLLSA
jgi:hypothetical protein